MTVSESQSPLEYLKRHVSLWRANGTGFTAVTVNVLALALFWLILPLESEPLSKMRRCGLTN